MMLRLWAGFRSKAKCKFCRKPIWFAIDDRGKKVPMEPNFTSEIQQVDDRGRRFELVDSGYRHKCP